MSDELTDPCMDWINRCFAAEAKIPALAAENARLTAELLTIDQMASYPADVCPELERGDYPALVEAIRKVAFFALNPQLAK